MTPAERAPGDTKLDRSVPTARRPRSHKFGSLGRRIKKVVTKAGDFNKTEVYFYDGQRIVQINNGSGTMVQQFIAPLTRRSPRSGGAARRHAALGRNGESRADGTQYIDELVMVRVADKGDLYVHQGERSEREWAATGKASRMRASGPRARPEGVSRRRMTAGANWNVIGLTDLGRHVVERSVYTPYGELTVHQDTGFGDRDGDQDVDSTDKATVGTTCTGTVSGSCRILDLDFDGDYDSTDANKFDALTQGAQRHPGRPATNVSQPFAHQALMYEPELAQYQNRARQYDPGKRRFAQRDPFTTTRTLPNYPRDGMNSYQYLMGAPQQQLDPTGLSCGAYTKAGASKWVTTGVARYGVGVTVILPLPAWGEIITTVFPVQAIEWRPVSWLSPAQANQGFICFVSAHASTPCTRHCTKQYTTTTVCGNTITVATQWWESTSKSCSSGRALGQTYSSFGVAACSAFPKLSLLPAPNCCGG